MQLASPAVSVAQEGFLEYLTAAAPLLAGSIGTEKQRQETAEGGGERGRRKRGRGR